jgi:uracil phosphoribosyltransferase
MKLKEYPNAFLLEHPLLQHKITLLRDKHTGTLQFRQVVKEVGLLEGYEVLKDLPTEMVEITTPIEKASEPMIAGKKTLLRPNLTGRDGHAGWFLGARSECQGRPHRFDPQRGHP